MFFLQGVKGDGKPPTAHEHVNTKEPQAKNFHIIIVSFSDQSFVNPSLTVILKYFNEIVLISLTRIRLFSNFGHNLS